MGWGGGRGCTKVFNSNVVKKITLSPNTCTLLDTSLQGFNLFFNTNENYSIKSNIILFKCCSSGKNFGLEFYQSLFRVPLTSYFGISQFIITWPSLSNKKKYVKTSCFCDALSIYKFSKKTKKQKKTHTRSPSICTRIKPYRFLA